MKRTVLTMRELNCIKPLQCEHSPITEDYEEEEEKCDRMIEIPLNSHMEEEDTTQIEVNYFSEIFSIVVTGEDHTVQSVLSVPKTQTHVPSRLQRRFRSNLGAYEQSRKGSNVGRHHRSRHHYILNRVDTPRDF
jgi:hypothetical protein